MKATTPIGTIAPTPKLMASFRLLGDDIAECKEPGDVIERLHSATSQTINVLGAWRTPARYDNWSAWQLNGNVFVQRDVPPTFFDDWLRGAKVYGQSAMAAKAARDGTPFTWTECARHTRMTGRSRWIFDLLREHGMRDGFCCPVGPWVLHYWSERSVKLTRPARSLLYSAAVLTVEQLMKLTASKRLGDAPPADRLSAREIEVLRLYSIGDRPREIAHHLGIAEMTVRDHLKTIKKKLGAWHISHAVALAIRGHLLAGCAGFVCWHGRDHVDALFDVVL